MTKECAICNQKINFLSSRLPISGGALCMSCVHRAGIVFDEGFCDNSAVIHRMKSFNSISVKEFYKQRVTLVKNHRPTNKIKNYLQIDNEHQSFFADGYILSFNNLVDFKLLEDEIVTNHGNLGGAMVGGLLLGGAGAVIGSMVSSKTSPTICSSLKIQLTLINAPANVGYITFIKGETKKKSEVYKTKCAYAAECLAALKMIIDTVQEHHIHTSNNPQSFSVADEINKLKYLLEDGTITPKEFQQQKQRLLDSITHEKERLYE